MALNLRRRIKCSQSTELPDTANIPDEFAFDIPWRKEPQIILSTETPMHLGSGPITASANVIQSPFRGGSDERVVSIEREPDGSDCAV
ncbi:MAG: hypothetical protein ACRCYS_01600, partial [Beijerinckiaceae bacterium]